MTLEEKQAWLEENPDVGVDDRRKLMVDVKVDSRTLKEALQRQNELEQELEAERTELEDATNKLRVIAEQKVLEKADYFRKMGYSGKLESVSDILKAKAWEEGLDPVERGQRSGASGNLKLNDAQYGRSSEGFDSYEDMIYNLSERAKRGDRVAQEQKRKLEEKFMSAIKSGDLPTIFYDENKPEFKGQPSIIKKVLERENEKIRQKAIERRGED